MYKWVKNYVGVPFLSGGRTLQGCDCYGLIRLVFLQEFNRQLPELSNDYTDARNIRETAALFAKNMPVLLAEKIAGPEEGAVAVIREQNCLCHVGLCAGDGFILHAAAKLGSVCQRASHPDLAGRIEGYYRVG
jgi:cell wall-associated NlpC family hydrolase